MEFSREASFSFCTRMGSRMGASGFTPPDKLRGEMSVEEKQWSYHRPEKEEKAEGTELPSN